MYAGIKFAIGLVLGFAFAVFALGVVIGIMG